MASESKRLSPAREWLNAFEAGSMGRYARPGEEFLSNVFVVSNLADIPDRAELGPFWFQNKDDAEQGMREGFGGEYSDIRLESDHVYIWPQYMSSVQAGRAIAVKYTSEKKEVFGVYGKPKK